VEYIPYGEVFVEERNNQFSTNYLFIAKELDNETGLYYYGARYLDPTGAMWLSVDPMWEKNIDATPYNYCHGNPIAMTDPDGMDDVSIEYIDIKWRISQVVLDGSGDDRFFIKIEGKSSIDVVRFSNGDPEKCINCLNLYVGDTKSPDYSVDNKGNVIYDGEKSKAHLTSFDKDLDATRIYDYEYSDRCRIGTPLPAESYDKMVNVKTAKKYGKKYKLIYIYDFCRNQYVNWLF
jgi:RHS repeat-associated protein